MRNKARPNGFVARCQCGVCVGALDANRTEQNDMGKLLGKWLFDGCTVEPLFGHRNEVTISNCRCKEAQ
ncbi:hypothetical protein GCM10022421_32460 [Oceanisphaera sediminis]|uniref:Uncharacterized protein n=1 Tax=Oceanisphaera sediminis TaxID=981381 RepID=A0ABP7EM95_9GAMM